MLQKRENIFSNRNSPFAKKIPRGANLILLLENDKELYKKNMALAEKEKHAGKEIVLVKIKKLDPLPKSRIRQPVLASVAV